MPSSATPAPPKVHAPQRLSGEAVTADPPVAALREAAPSGLAPGSQGATVTASVSGTSAPPVTAGPGTTAVPATAVPTSSGPVGGPGGLARTGADLGLVLVFALVAVLLGVLLVRLGNSRSASHSPQGAPCTLTAA